MSCRKFRGVLFIALLLIIILGTSGNYSLADDNIRLPIELSDKEIIGEFYADRNGEPLWIKKSKRLNSSARDMLVVLKQSWMNGLNPQNYHLGAIEEILGSKSLKSQVSKDQAVFLEMILTDAYIRYRRDISGMRINARDMNLTSKHWQQRISVDEALQDLSNHREAIADFLLLAEPQGRTYQTLKTELVRLVEKTAQDDIKPIYFDTILRPGQGHNNVPILRERFKLPEVSKQDRFKYDNNLEAAIKAFQHAHGLKDDGLIGKQTQKALNKTHVEKIRQLIVNLERLRWVAEEKPERFIVVNLPSAMLWAIESGNVVAEMPVIIGRKKRPTESFVTEVHGVRFNPTWTIPKTIKREDIWPELRENSSYLQDKGIEVYQNTEEGKITIDPSSVDWASLMESDLNNYGMVQTSGAHNPLGWIRILMPNQHNIYLHDTNHPELFSRSNRAQSSGCIRMKYPEKIADFILKDRKHWSKETMIDILKSGDMKDLYVQNTMPIYLLYNTVWLGDKNQIIYGEDIYDFDSKLWYLLEKLDGSAKFGDN